MILSELCPVVTAQHAEFYIYDSDRDPARSRYWPAMDRRVRPRSRPIDVGEGLVGQCAIDKQKILLDDLPPDYIRIASGMGSASPRSVLVLPLIFEGQGSPACSNWPLSRASARATRPSSISSTESIGIVLNTIEANMRTEDCSNSPSRSPNSSRRAWKNCRRPTRRICREVEVAGPAEPGGRAKEPGGGIRPAELSKRAEQLALTSKYKSEFLANMSHELRTPLNSLLILSDQLSKNPDGNLTSKQQDFAKTIHSSAVDQRHPRPLEDRVGDGSVDAGDLRLEDLHGYVEENFPARGR